MGLHQFLVKAMIHCLICQILSLRYSSPPRGCSSSLALASSPPSRCAGGTPRPAKKPAVRKLWAVWPMGVPAIDLGKSKLFVPDCDLDADGPRCP